ncbi:histidinol-phosphatase HisJ family protein [Caldicellulosiruptoraceae bacterium PP1]
MFDYHVHSNFSSDSKMSMEEAIISAISKGIKEIAFTDHVDLLYPPVSYTIIEIDYDKYVDIFSQLKEKYKDDISIKLGVEVGIQPHSITKSKELIDKYPFDFIIASTHAVEFKDLCEGDFFVNKSKDEAYRIYFEDILNIVNNFNDFCVYGHLDIVKRYGNYEDKSLDVVKYIDIIDEIFKKIIEKEKGIEINTSGFRYNLNSTHPQIDIIKRYKELGGEIITLGSDSHFKEHIGYKFDYVLDLLKSLGFRYITRFDKRIPIYEKI